MPPTSIDGSEITDATIDGQDVSEITVDGQTVFTATPDTQVVAISGRDNNRNNVGNVERFDGSTWQSLPNLPTPRFWLAATTDGQGRPLAIGGKTENPFTGFETVATVERFDGSTWQSLPNLPSPRERLAATTDGQGRPLAIGGGGVARFDGSSWESLPDLPTPRDDLAAATDAQGRPVAIGGRGGPGTVERFDGSSWESLPDLPTPREQLAATTDGQGRILAMGGEAAPVDPESPPVATVERFDGSTWESLPDLPTPRHFLAAATDAQGRPLAIGGNDSPNRLATVERFDGSTWESLPDLPKARYRLAAATLSL